MGLNTQLLGTRLDLELFAKTTLGPIVFQVLDEQGNAWPVTTFDEIHIWVKSHPDDADVDALIAKKAVIVEPSTSTFQITLSPIDTDLDNNNYVHQVVLGDGVNQYVIFYGDFIIQDRIPN